MPRVAPALTLAAAVALPAGAPLFMYDCNRTSRRHARLMHGSLRAGGGRPSSCRLLPLSGGKASRDRRVARLRVKTALDLVPCGVRSFGYWRKVQVMSGNKDKGKKCGQSNKLPFVLMGGHICVDAAQGGLASVLPFLVIQSGFS